MKKDVIYSSINISHGDPIVGSTIIKACCDFKNHMFTDIPACKLIDKACLYGIGTYTVPDDCPLKKGVSIFYWIKDIENGTETNKDNS